jgi:hypothetical protein
MGHRLLHRKIERVQKKNTNGGILTLLVSTNKTTQQRTSGPATPTTIPSATNTAPILRGSTGEQK